ncbi:ribokinase [Edaphovirga cremea]|uniref:ribokinase n=1 Tax=Edaphovirga cremea TaxID=2267246 RepID=UPI000DEF55DD|nr:ribokinase [Edaphovirga cremea]
MSKIIVAGSLHYDIMLQAHHRPEKGETVIGSHCSFKFGGKGGNQAVSAAKAGAQVRFVGAVGSDHQGEFLLSVLKGQGIDTHHVAVTDVAPSGMSVAIMDADNDYGAVVVSNANNHIDPSQFDNDDVWQGATMLLLQNEVPEALNLQAASAAKQRGITVCLNAAPARELSAQMQACIDLLVVNAVEARDLCGIDVNDLDSARAAANALSLTFPVAVVTAGEHGVAFCETARECQSLPAEKVVLVSTHGAGDCFMGTLCASLQNGDSLTQAVTLANQAAGEHVSRRQS